MKNYVRHPFTLFTCFCCPLYWENELAISFCHIMDRGLYLPYFILSGLGVKTSSMVSFKESIFLPSTCRRLQGLKYFSTCFTFQKLEIWNWILGLGDINFLPLLLNSWQEGGFSWWKRSHYYGKLIPLVMYPEILGRWQISVGVFLGGECDAPLWVQCKALVGTRQQNSQKLQGFSTLKVLTFD